MFNYTFYIMKALEESLYIHHLENHSNPPQEAMPRLGSGNHSLKYLNQTRQTLIMYPGICPSRS